MFTFNFARKAKTTADNQTVFATVSSAEDVTLRIRRDDFIKRGEDEYARLYHMTQELVGSRISGGFSVNRNETLSRINGQMETIQHSLAIIKGVSPAQEGYDLERKAQERAEEKFPSSSFIASAPSTAAPVKHYMM